MVVKASNVYPKDSEAPPCGVDDMTKLAYLHEPGVLDNLKSRYDINEIYVSARCKEKIDHIYSILIDLVDIWRTPVSFSAFFLYGEPDTKNCVFRRIQGIF